MKTVGSILREARNAKGLSLSDVEKATKIRHRFLEALERDSFASLPSSSYTKGFVRNYAEYLGIAPEKIMAFYRRQTAESSKSTIVPKGVVKPINAPFFTLTPGTFLTLFITGLLLVFFAYLGRQYFRLQEPPRLTLEAPQENQVFSERKIAIEGSTESDATVTINTMSIIVREDGRFYEQVNLEEGQNIFTIEATSRFGKSVIMKRTVEYMP